MKAKHRANPTVIDAVRFTDESALLGFVPEATLWAYSGSCGVIVAVPGDLIVELNLGDWLVRPAGGGQLRAYTPMEFEATFEAIADDLAKGTAEENRPLTFGEKAVGLSFNPGGHALVDQCKKIFAAAIDQMHDLRNQTVDPEVKRMASVAITETQAAQMWAVKAITWRG